MPDARRQTRPPVQRDRIVRDIRRSIVAGRRAPSSRLPTRQELIRRYATGPITVQEAIEQLRAEGFVETDGRRGTYVSPRPPHLFRYGLVFHERPPQNAPLTFFYQALMDEAKRDRGRRIDLFYLSDPFHDRDREAYQDLLETVLNDGIAGLVFTFSPFMLRPTPVLRKPGLPRVGVMGSSDPTMPGISPVYVDHGRWIAMALDAVKARGCRRVAFLGLAGVLERVPGHFERGVQERGLFTRELWVQGVHDRMGPWIGQVARLMMDGPADRRPDALLIADDNLLEHATAGFVEAGLRAPRDVYVVAHTNFPNPAPAAVQVERLGFDVRAVLQTCWNMIDLQRRGLPTPTDAQLISPIFEHEFNPNTAPLVAARETFAASAG